MKKIGIDTGGTFTDFVLIEENTLKTYKVPSTPRDPSEALLRGLAELLRRKTEESIPSPADKKKTAATSETPSPDVITHGSTVATNALLERKGATVALLTTAGFEDILEIARQNRPSLYDLNVEKPPPLIAGRHIFGVNERVLYDGTVERTPDPAEIDKIAKKIISDGCDSIAICFLHSYRNPANEQLVANLLAGLKLPLCTSHQVLPEYREYERFSTTSINAFVSPKMASYIERIERGLPEKTRLRIMQSNGGSISASRARQEAVQTILSGPAAGVVGAFETARSAGFDQIITFDMGGTSTDVSLCDGKISTRSNSKISGIPVAIPVVDIHTVGAGGGSIAWLDSARSLHVGPQSAGAEPGPVCYGAGTELTVTDANLCLGRMLADRFLGGGIKLDVDRARVHMLKFANYLGMSPEQAAEGIVRVANATMERAIRVISVERGYDPRRFALVAFGGAGPMHACSLARALAIQHIIIPQNAGVLSALGLLMADVRKDFSRTVLIKAEAVQKRELDSLFAALEGQAEHIFQGEGFSRARLVTERLLDMRYAGQSYEVTVPATEDFLSAFHREHFRLYGHSDDSREVEIVTVRLAASGPVERPQLLPQEETGKIATAAAALVNHRAVFGGQEHRTPVYDRAQLRPGNELSGPAVIVEMSATTVIEPDFACKVDAFGNLLIQRGIKGAVRDPVA